MPIFEYKCNDCGAQFETLSISSSSRVVCKKCESPNVRKLLSVFAVAKGSSASSEASPCSTCSARERGMCGE